MEAALEQTVNIAWNKRNEIMNGIVYGVIALVMIIPMVFVKDLIYERQVEADREIISKWTGLQNIIGPVVVVPFLENNNSTTSSLKPLTKQIAQKMQW